MPVRKKHVVPKFLSEGQTVFVHSSNGGLNNEPFTYQTCVRDLDTGLGIFQIVSVVPLKALDNLLIVLKEML